ncbi:lamin tail domain-containing protein [Rhizomonospora bruguierae]|uniref:lamin tail domain-containing protein n=1 Tax=Rhizomonospora bruguierae TaxID=1581705 RepID=UPI001BCC2E86|nr:lamin tail domain-containing protein [Micromonospora sp. NBRC 107566]
MIRRALSRALALRATAVVAAIAAGAFAIPGPAQAATPAIQITKVQYNSPGPDNRSNASRNAEWVRLTNTTKSTINLKNWTLRDKANHVYKFTTDYRLAPGRRVYIHTGNGTNGKPDAQHRYWNSGNYIWNNTGDTATVRNPAGKTIDTCKWGSKGSVTYC